MKPRLFNSFLAIASLVFSLSFISCGEDYSALHAPILRHEYKQGKEQWIDFTIVNIEATTDPMSFKAETTFYDNKYGLELRQVSVYTFNVSMDYISWEDQISRYVKVGDEWVGFWDWLNERTEDYLIDVALKKDGLRKGSLLANFVTSNHGRNILHEWYR